jgi:hypothetical protein
VGGALRQRKVSETIAWSHPCLLRRVRQHRTPTFVGNPKRQVKRVALGILSWAGCWDESLVFWWLQKPGFLLLRHVEGSHFFRMCSCPTWAAPSSTCDE